MASNKSKYNTKKFNALFGSGRMCGVFLHPTSLPSKFGIGDLGENARRFVDFLEMNNQQIWQILPLGPTGYGNSPYQCFSAFAGNPLLISLSELKDQKLLDYDDLKFKENFSDSKVNFNKVKKIKNEILKKAFYNFNEIPKNHELKKKFEGFLKKNRFWLEDFSLYISLKEYFNQKPWYEWDHRFKFRNSSTLNNWREEHQDKIQYYEFIQFIFFEQWKKIKVYANKKGIKIFGDIPIFVAYDSSDVWAHPDYFYLDKKGDLEYVAGVPPDEFSETGQRWGNPLYQWEVLEEQDFDWWIQRIKFSFKLIDLLRIDHFRGFEAYWRIPAEESTAVIGKWIPGPGYKFFKTLKEKLGPLPIIAEDLGVITKEVEDLLEKTGYPGMRVLQFAFGNKKSDERVSKYLPHNYIPKTVVYTGTHDNNTTKGWFDSLPKKIQKWVLNYTGTERDNLVYNLIRLAISSVSRICIIPLQDVLKLGEEARMNLPGTMEGNWEWRFTWDLFNDEDIAKFKNFCQIYERDSINNVKN